MYFFETILYFLVAIAVLIAVHEWGHFLMARWMKVKVLRFSIGFGKVLWSRVDKTGTEYALSIIPLGGYVKMLDEDEGPVSDKERPYAYSAKPVWARMLIVAGGPLFNILFALLALWLMFLIGIYTLAPIVGSVQPGSIAAKAGVVAHDEIMAASGLPIKSWRSFQLEMMDHLGDKKSLALTLKKINSDESRQVNLELDGWVLNAKKPELLKSLGLKPFIPELKPIIGRVMKLSSAQKAGLQHGDEVVSINEQPIKDWLDLVALVKSHPKSALTFKINRQAQRLTLTVIPGVKKDKSGQERGFIGAMVKTEPLPKDWLRLHRLDPWNALIAAGHETIKLTHMTFVMIGKFITAKVSLSNLSGPIGIAKGAGDSARSGVAYYLSFLALVSISLGVLNSLPIPLLDGGHFAFLLFEGIAGRKPPLWLVTNSMYLGMFFLISLMMLAGVNDLWRLL